MGGPGGAGGGQYHYQTVNPEDLEDLFGGSSPFSDFFQTFFSSSFTPGSGQGQRSGVGREQSTGRVYTGAGHTRQAQQRAAPAQDVESELDVTLAEAYQGVTRLVEVRDEDGATRRLEVKIPAGVDEGSRIRIAGQGTQGRGGRGHLYLRVHMAPDAQYKREGTILRTTVDVPLAVAMLGGDVLVPTPDGRRLQLRIPLETPNGKVFRLRNQGMPHLGKPEQRGDLYAEIKVVLPTHLNAEQHRLFEEFARSIGYSHPAQDEQ